MPKTMVKFMSMFALIGWIVFPASAETFQSAADCQRRYDEIRAEGDRWDMAWMDCSAGAAHSSIQDCRAMSSQQRVSTSRNLARKRDAAWAQARQLRPLCEQMLANERDRARQDAFARANEQARSRRDTERRQQISREQYIDDRIAATRYLGDNNRTAEVVREREMAAAAAAAEDERAKRRAVAAGKVADILTSMLVEEEPKTVEHGPALLYDRIQDDAEEVHGYVQTMQPDAVTEIQKGAWQRIRQNHKSALSEVDHLSDSIRSSTVEPDVRSEVSPPFQATFPPFQLETRSSVPGRTGIDAELDLVAAGAYAKAVNEERSARELSFEHSLRKAQTVVAQSDSIADEAMTTAHTPPGAPTVVGAANASPSSSLRDESCDSASVQRAIDSLRQSERRQISQLPRVRQKCASAKLDLAIHRHRLENASHCQPQSRIGEMQRALVRANDQVRMQCERAD